MPLLCSFVQVFSGHLNQWEFHGSITDDVEEDGLLFCWLAPCVGRHHHDGLLSLPSLLSCFMNPIHDVWNRHHHQSTQEILDYLS